MADELEQELERNRKVFLQKCQGLEERIKEALVDIETTEDPHFSPGFKQQLSPCNSKHTTQFIVMKSGS